MFACAVFALLPAKAGEYPGVVPVSGQMPTALIELDGTGSETYDGGGLTYRWTQLAGPRVELSDPAAAKPYFRTGLPGLYRFELVVTANGLDSEPFVVEIMIERDNLPPVAKVDAEVLGEIDKPLTVDGSGSFDPEGEPLIYRWRLVSGGRLEIPPEELSKPAMSFIPGQDGVFEVELVVSDGKDVSPPVTARLYIKPRPRPPVARARAVPREIPTAPPPEAETAMAPPLGVKPVAKIQGPAVAMMGEKVMLDARGSGGPEPSRLKYFWSQKSGPFVSGYELVFDGAAQRFSPPRAGDYEFELRVTDGRLESEPAIHSLKVVNEPEPPVAVVEAPARAMPGALIKLDATRSFDLEGSKLTYHWRQTGGPKVTRYLIDETLGDAVPAFHPPNDGLYSFELVVSNERGMRSKPIEIDIEVGASRRRLDVGVAGPQVMRTGERFVLEAVVQNEPKEDLAFVWRQSDGPGLVLEQVEGRNVGLVITLPGRYVFDLAVLDPAGVRGSARQVVEIFGPPAALGGAPSPRMKPPPTLPQARADIRRNRDRPLRPPPVAGSAAPDSSALEPLAPLPATPGSQPLAPLPSTPVNAAPPAAFGAPIRPPPPPAFPSPEMPSLEPIHAAPGMPAAAANQSRRIVDAGSRRPAAQIHPETLGAEPFLIPPAPALTPSL
ncbi:MAG: hypothetical protein LBT97_11475 [Planctomycetota bacterium]|jgi:hypothetical protein|nr:hypothetical protein [Planctomycetota bacterium]